MGFIKKHIDLGLVGHEPLILHPALSSLADEQGGPQRVKRSGRTQEVNWGWAINPGFPFASHQTNMEPDSGFADTRFLNGSFVATWVGVGVIGMLGNLKVKRIMAMAYIRRFCHFTCGSLDSEEMQRRRSILLDTCVWNDETDAWHVPQDSLRKGEPSRMVCFADCPSKHAQ